MAQTTNNCEVLRNEINDSIESMKKEFVSKATSQDLEYIKTFDNEFQVKGYAQLCRKEWIIYIMKNVSKLVAVISTIAGAITAIIEVFTL